MLDIFGIGFYLTGTYWISNSLQFDESFKNLIPFTIVLLPLFLGLFYGLGALICGKYLKYDLPSLFLFCASISFVDYLRAKILTDFLGIFGHIAGLGLLKQFKF